MTTVPAAPRRVRARVGEIVQGVGVRPYVYQLAAHLNLSGFVLNDEPGVLVEVEGSAATVDEFLARLSAEAPPLARVRPGPSRASGRCPTPPRLRSRAQEHVLPRERAPRLG